nr:cupin [Salipiger mucosus]
MTPRSAADIAPVTRQFAAGGGMPNNPALPVVIYRGALPGAAPDEVCALMEGNGWGGTWVWSVFEYHHYHPDAHEALVAASGAARLMLGGPEGVSFEISAGDALILPAGTGHCRLSQSEDFRICGAYPPGQEDYATRRAGPEAEADAAQIAQVPLPETDPIYGRQGPLMALWG